MKFMMIVKADKRSEAGEMPSEAALAAMGRYNEALVKAGILLDATGLQPSSKGARVGLRNGRLQVTDGPFTESKELIAGYWLIQAKSKEEAIEWAKRIPFEYIPETDGTREVEIRQLFELADFGQSQSVEHHKQLGQQIGKR